LGVVSRPGRERGIRLGDVWRAGFAELVDAELRGWVGVLGEPDERDGVVVHEGVDLEEVRELFCLAEAGGVLVCEVLAFAPVGPQNGTRSMRPNPPRAKRITHRRTQRPEPNSVILSSSLLSATTTGVRSRCCFSRVLGNGLMIRRLIAAVSFPSLVARCPSSCASTAGRYSFSSRPRESISVFPHTAASGWGSSVTNHVPGSRRGSALWAWRSWSASW
jgi:hypothetical protein